MTRRSHSRVGPVTGRAPGATTESRSWPSRLAQVRHPGDAVRVALAAGAIAATTLFVHRGRVTVLERDVFRICNDLPGWMFPILWAPMQLGNFLAIPVVAAAAAATRRFRLAAEIAITGTGVWLIAKLVKQQVVRGRPDEVLPGVHTHGAAATGLGYPSGHAAVVAAMATLIIPYLSRRSRRVAVALILTVCLARMYVGAHFPLDVVAGAAIGWGVASAVHFLLGAPSGRPRMADVSRALSELGHPPASIIPLGLDARRSALFHVVSTAGRDLFVKVYPRERRDRDWLYRIWETLGRRRRPQDGDRCGSLALHREAAMAVQATHAGARVPKVIAVGTSRQGAGVLVQEAIFGQPLDVAARGCDSDALLRVLDDLWYQLSALQQAHLAHHGLTASHLLVDDAARLHIVGFAEARMGASEDELVGDVADALVVSADLAGAGPALVATSPHIGPSRLEGALDLLRSTRGRRRARATLGRKLPAEEVDGLQSVLAAVMRAGG